MFIKRRQLNRAKTVAIGSLALSKLRRSSLVRGRVGGLGRPARERGRLTRSGDRFSTLPRGPSRSGRGKTEIVSVSHSVASADVLESLIPYLCGRQPWA
jgi:hypothetical protein